MKLIHEITGQVMEFVDGAESFLAAIADPHHWFEEGAVIVTPPTPVEPVPMPEPVPAVPELTTPEAE